MPRKGYRVITLSEEAYSTLLKEKRPGETWDDMIKRIVQYTWERFLADLAKLGRG